jgi:hypothetical protein
MALVLPKKEVTIRNLKKMAGLNQSTNESFSKFMHR